MTGSYEGEFGPLIETTMRVATWNLWWRFGPWEERQPAIVDWLRRIDADVLAFQEVWDDGESNQAEIMAADLGYEFVYEARLELDGVRFGNAVLSRWPITGTEVEGYGATPDTEELRLLLRADVDGPRGPFQVFCTHLNWRLDHSAARQGQVRQLCGFVADSRPRDYPAILCGDFNADPDSDEIRMLTGQAAVPVDKLVFLDAWRTGGDGSAGSTWSNENPFAASALEPDRRIDYVFTGWPRLGGAGHVVHAEVAGHAPLVDRLETRLLRGLAHDQHRGRRLAGGGRCTRYPASGDVRLDDHQRRHGR